MSEALASVVLGSAIALGVQWLAAHAALEYGEALGEAERARARADSNLWRHMMWAAFAALAGGLLAYEWSALGWTIAFASCLAGATRVDGLFRLIPDRLQIMGGLIVVATLALAPEALIEGGDSLRWHVLQGISLPVTLFAFTWVFERLRGHEGLGLGDVKALVWIGAALGSGVWYAVTYALLAALVVSAMRLVSRRGDWQDAFAFMPYIFFGVLVHAAVLRLAA